MPKGLIVEIDRDDETHDILPRSAIVCRAAGDGRPLLGEHGFVDIWFEGNLHKAVNLVSFIDKIACAAGRMVTNYPTTAHNAVELGQIRVLAEYDLRRNFITRILDEEGWRQMLDHLEVTYLAPPAPEGDVTDMALIVAEMDRVGFRHVSAPTGQIDRPFVFQLKDGRILVHEPSGEGRLLWPDDPRIEELRDRLPPDVYVRIEPDLDELASPPVT